MTHLPPWKQLCDCRCPVHHGFQRTTYNDERCACTITCATQPITLIAKQWDCALFLDHGGDLWFVDPLAPGLWDWSSAGHFREDHELYEASRIIERKLRQTATILADPPQLRHDSA